MITVENKKLVPLQEYAKSIGKTRQTIYAWLKSNKLRSKKIGCQQFIIVE